jgi:hypothetical protein
MTQQERNTEEIDHLPIPAFAPRFWDAWARKRRRSVMYNGRGVNYVDAIQAFDVRTCI